MAVPTQARDLQRLAGCARTRCTRRLWRRDLQGDLRLRGRVPLVSDQRLCRRGDLVGSDPGPHHRAERVRLQPGHPAQRRPVRRWRPDRARAAACAPRAPRGGWPTPQRSSWIGCCHRRATASGSGRCRTPSGAHSHLVMPNLQCHLADSRRGLRRRHRHVTDLPAVSAQVEPSRWRIIAMSSWSTPPASRDRRRSRPPAIRRPPALPT